MYAQCAACMKTCRSKSRRTAHSAARCIALSAAATVTSRALFEKSRVTAASAPCFLTFMTTTLPTHHEHGSRLVKANTTSPRYYAHRGVRGGKDWEPRFTSASVVLGLQLRSQPVWLPACPSKPKGTDGAGYRGHVVAQFGASTCAGPRSCPTPLACRPPAWSPFM